MCGLILAPRRYQAKVPEALERMAYRGPDAANIATRGDWVLGHNRLAIQDTRSPAAIQPFQDPDRTWAFVGEVFNRPRNCPTERLELRSALVRQDFHELDGFWSIIDLIDTRAVAYTDHLGIKPLYWWPEHGIVCSEITPMFALEPAPPLDELYLSNCIKWGYDYCGRTAWQGIIQLSPGSRLILSPFGAGLRPYWEWSQVETSGDLPAELDQAISNRMVGDRPVALLLSGGLDSSIIYYSLKAQGKEVRAFSVENGESEFLPDGVEVLTTTAPPHAFEAVETMQAPLDLGSLFPQIQLAGAVQDAGFNVAMSGDGADELFGGYRRAQEYDSQHSDIFCELPFYHLPRLDRVMMRSTVELRSPFLAPRVVAHALSLPYHFRRSKEALKIAYQGIVPEEIINRPKHPLKTEAVKTGGVAYRQQLVQEFRHVATQYR